MGLTHHVGRALERGTFADLLDPAVHDWPMEEAHRFAEISLRCCELRRKDRPDLATVVLPELNRLRALGEDNMEYCNPMGGRGGMHSSSASHSGPYSNPRHVTPVPPSLLLLSLGIVNAGGDLESDVQDGVSDPSIGRPNQHHSSNGSQAAMPTRRLNYN